MMELRQIQYLVALFEERSVTRAARRLNVVQPAVSMQIAKLEEELGRPLFRRMPKGMMPTEAGIEAYRHFSKVLADIRLARDHLASLGDRVAGHVSVGVIASVSNNALSDCLGSYCARYPEVSLRITGGYTADFIEMVRSGELDLAIINHVRRRVGLSMKRLVREELVLVMAAARQMQAQEPVSLAEIAAMKLVVPSTRHGLRGIIDDMADQAGVFLRPHLEFDELKTIEEFVTGSDYVTILPPIAIRRSLELAGLVARPIVPRIVRDIVAVYDPRRGLSRAADLLVAELGRVASIEFDRNSRVPAH